MATLTIYPNVTDFYSFIYPFIRCSDDTYTIRYTTDGSTPSETNGTIYSQTDIIVLASTTEFKAIAYKTGETSIYANKSYNYIKKDYSYIDYPEEIGNYYYKVVYNTVHTSLASFYSTTINNINPISNKNYSYIDYPSLKGTYYYKVSMTNSRITLGFSNTAIGITTNNNVNDEFLKNFTDYGLNENTWYYYKITSVIE